MSTWITRALTFLGGAAGTVAVAGVASGYPKWLVITCIAIMGGSAKLSDSPLPPTREKAPPP